MAESERSDDRKSEVDHHHGPEHQVGSVCFITTEPRALTLVHRSLRTEPQVQRTQRSHRQLLVLSPLCLYLRDMSSSALRIVGQSERM